MKTMKMMWLLFLAAGLGTSSGAGDTLDDLLDRRIEINVKYRDQYTEEAGESKFAEKLQPIEKEVGQAWVDYLKYVKSLKDEKLKEQVLRIELLHELSSCYNDLEYAEGVLEEAQQRGKIRKWERELKLLDKIVGKGKVTVVKEEKK